MVTPSDFFSIPRIKGEVRSPKFTKKTLSTCLELMRLSQCYVMSSIILISHKLSNLPKQSTYLKSHFNLWLKIESFITIQIVQRTMFPNKFQIALWTTYVFLETFLLKIHCCKFNIFIFPLLASGFLSR